MIILLVSEIFIAKTTVQTRSLSCCQSAIQTVHLTGRLLFADFHKDIIEAFPVHTKGRCGTPSESKELAPKLPRTFRGPVN